MVLGPVELRRVRGAMADYAGGFDAAAVSAAAAGEIVGDAAAIEKMAATVKSLAAARVAQTRLWERDGDLSPAHALARRTGTSVGRAKAAIRTAARLGSQPRLAEAARRGDLSPEQVAAISDAAAANPGAEQRLVAGAATSSLAQLREDCERATAAADPDADARQRRIHRSRFARRRDCPDGSGEIVYRSTRAEVAEAWAVVSAFAGAAFRRARSEGRREGADAYAADGFLEMARAAATGGGGEAPSNATGADVSGGSDHCGAGAADPGSGANAPGGQGPSTTAGSASAGPSAPGSGTASSATGSPGPGLGADEPGRPDGSEGSPASCASGAPVDTLFPDPTPASTPASTPAPAPRASVVPTKAIVRIDWEALVRGWPVDGETCEITGVGPVPVTVVREMIASGDVFLAAVVTKGVDVVNVVHLGRSPTAHQMTALQWMQPTCSVEGCDRIWLQSDHRHDWADTHVTMLRWLDRLCTAHHAMKTRRGWALVEGTGKRRFVPPEDPRHPRHPRHTAQSTHPPPS